MPIYVGYTQKRRTIRIITAGKTRYLLCPPTDIELLAEITDETNTRNHTFFWEQISGPPVVLASTDTLGTSFPFADSEDKVFRFWLDYGTNKAQYKDVNIFYTPTSIMEKRAAGTDMFHQSMTIPNLSKQEMFLFDDADGTFNSNVTKIPATLVSFDPVEPLSTLQKSVKFEILTDDNYVVDPTTVYASYDYAAGEYLYDIPLPNGVYRFKFYYDFGTLELKEIISPYVYLHSTAVTDGAWGIDDVETISDRGLNGSLDSLIRYSILRQVIDDTVQIDGFSSGLVNPDGTLWKPGDQVPTGLRLSVREVRYTDYPDLVENYQINTGLEKTLLSVVRLDPSNIGS